MHYKVKVTIGLCVKNNDATVKEAIDSVVNQDYPHELMELIVVDGNSKDKTMSIVKKALLKSEIETKIFFENRGLGIARQMVVDNATGDYIIWVDGDMVLSKDHVRKQVEFMERNPSVGIAGGKFQMYPRENLVAMLESLEWIVADYMHGQKASFKPVLHRAGGCIYRVKAIRQVGGLDCRIQGALEDLDAEYRLGEKGWLTYFVTDAVFYDRRKETWKAIWDENFWYGYGGHFFLHKYGKSLSASALLYGLKRTFIAYKLTRRKVVFLFPLQYIFKKIAWCFGFFKAHFDGYGHSVARVHPK
jgi:glycosyltransferase involved in cell wall biosynthesis